MRVKRPLGFFRNVIAQEINRDAIAKRHVQRLTADKFEVRSLGARHEVFAHEAQAR